MSSFDYPAIKKEKNQIRLLRIIPRSQHVRASETNPPTLASPTTSEKRDALVSCTMKVASLDDRPTYTALSYVWGDKSNKKSVLVDGSVVEITANLEEALRQFEQEKEPVILWADALCINQDNGLEKEHQVQLMSRIYKTASKVVVWLGLPEDRIDGTIDLLNDIGREASNIGIFGLELPDFQNILSSTTKESLCGIKESLENMVKRTIFKIPWLDLNKLFYNPWFSRIWVIQEVAVSSDDAAIITCGEKRLPYQYLTASLLFLTYFQMRSTQLFHEDPEKGKFWDDMSNFNSIIPARAVISRRAYQREGNRTQESLFQILERVNTVDSKPEMLQASDPRDRIYALLGMTRDTPQLGLKPDYSKSCVEVFTDATVAMLRCRHFDILTLNQFPKEQKFPNEDSGLLLPSWVPDWTSRIQTPCGGLLKDGFFRSCGEKEPFVNFDSGCKILFITGCIVDMITKVGAPWLPTIEDWKNWSFSPEKYGPYLDEIASLCNESDSLAYDIYKSPQQRLEAIWRIPCANRTRNQNVRSRPSTNGAELLEGYNYIKAGLQPESPNVINYRVTMGDMFKRRPFISIQGYVGLVPSHTEPGDVLCILYGCIVPFVLRKRINGRGYELVGEAYVHGIMDGEFVEREHVTETFELH